MKPYLLGTEVSSRPVSASSATGVLRRNGDELSVGCGGDSAASRGSALLIAPRRQEVPTRKEF